MPRWHTLGRVSHANQLFARSKILDFGKDDHFGFGISVSSRSIFLGPSRNLKTGVASKS